MAKKASKGGLKLVSGGPGRRPMAWRVSNQPGLSRTYTFVPGVATYVEPEDAAWFADPENLGGRVFEVVAPDPAPAAKAAPGGHGAAAGSATSAGSTAPGGSTGATGGAPGGKTDGAIAKTTTADKPAGDAGQN